MTDYFLIRHAHVDYCPPAQITAHNPLTPLGHQMAALLAERCVDMGLQYLFVSTFRRCQETAAPISVALPDLPRIDLSELTETHIGDLAGYSGEMPSEDLRTWQDAHYAYANEAMWCRARAGWEQVQRIARERELERVGIVTHGGPINAILRHHMGEDGVVRLRVCWIDLDWSAVSCVRDKGTRRSVRFVNDARHIDPLRDWIPPDPFD